MFDSDGMPWLQSTIKTGMTSPVSDVLDPWPLLRKHEEVGCKRALRLIVHGRAGGYVPSCVRSFALQVAQRRGTPVLVEALTATDRHEQSADPIWLVPLLLLPGSHVREDVPLIRQRLQQQGVNTRLVPFLGAWPSWWRLLQEWVERQDCRHDSLVLVHHPLRQGVAHRYLSLLQQRLALPMLSWDDWHADVASAKEASTPLFLALAPIQITQTLRDSGVMTSLLEIELFRLGLIDLLAALP